MLCLCVLCRVSGCCAAPRCCALFHRGLCCCVLCCILPLCVVPLLAVSHLRALSVALGSCAYLRCVFSCFAALCGLCCVSFALLCRCVLLFAAVLPAVCVLGCRAARYLSFRPCAVLRCALRVRVCRAVGLVCAASGACTVVHWCVLCGCLWCSVVRCPAALMGACCAVLPTRCAVSSCCLSCCAAAFAVGVPVWLMAGCPVAWCGALSGPALPWCPASLYCALWCCASVWCCGVLSCCLVWFVGCVCLPSPTLKTTAKFVKLVFGFWKYTKFFTQLKIRHYPTQARRQAARTLVFF